MIKRRAVITASIILTIVVAGLTVLLLVYTQFWPNSYDSNPSDQPPTTSPEEDMLACIDALPSRIKIGQKIMVAVYSNQLSNEIPVIANASTGGVIVMDMVTASQIDNFRTNMAITPIIAVDQEGGTVQRYTSNGYLPGADEMANNFSADQAYNRYLGDNKYLKSIGITTNFAPVVDVISGSFNPLPGRLYSANPDTVVEYASAAIRAAKDAGITPVIKHFPGLGSATGNTDYVSATTDPISALQTRDLIPYRQLAQQSPDVMIANAIVPGLTAGRPAVWSPEAISLLRDMGYQKAVVYTDSLTAQAVPGTLADAAIKAWQAGVDIALIVQTREQTPQLGSYLEEIIENASKALESGALNQEELSASIARIFDRKGVDACEVEI